MGQHAKPSTSVATDFSNNKADHMDLLRTLMKSLRLAMPQFKQTWKRRTIGAMNL
jgi:hypothetical protein